MSSNLLIVEATSEDLNDRLICWCSPGCGDAGEIGSAKLNREGCLACCGLVAICDGLAFGGLKFDDSEFDRSGFGGSKLNTGWL